MSWIYKLSKQSMHINVIFFNNNAYKFKNFNIFL